MGIVASSRRNGTLSYKKPEPFFNKPKFYYVCILGVSLSLVSRYCEGYKLAVSAKLRQPKGQTQDIFNFGPSLVKF
jgi:hypothetical protein